MQLPLWDLETGRMRPGFTPLSNGLSSSWVNIRNESKKVNEAVHGSKLTTTYMMTKYIHPMVEKGLLKLTLPATLKSKNQKWVVGQSISQFCNIFIFAKYFSTKPLVKKTYLGSLSLSKSHSKSESGNATVTVPSHARASS